MNNKPQEIWEYLVISILSVNQYKLDRTYLKFKNLEEVGLFFPDNLVKWNQNEILNKLVDAQLDRGPYMNNIFSARLKELGNSIENYGKEHYEKFLLSQDKIEIEKFLIQVKGIGNRTIQNFFFLMES